MSNRFKKIFLQNTTTGQTIFKNTVWLIFAEILSRLIRFVLIIYAARILGTDGWGTFSYALSAVGVYMSFSDFGLSPLLMKESVSKSEGSGAYLTAAFYIKLLLLSISLVLAIVTAGLHTGIPGASIIIPITAFILTVDSFREFVIILVRAQEKMEREALFRILTNVFIAVFGIGFLVIAPSAKNLAYAYLAGSTLGTVILCLSLRKQIVSSFTKTSLGVIKNLSGLIWPIAILGVSTSLMASIDTIMLGHWRPVHDIGIYAANQRIIQFIYIIPTFFISALFPTLVRLYGANRQRFTAVFEQALSIIFLIGLPVIIGGMAVSKELLSFIFGVPYGAGAASFNILLITLLCVFPNSLFYNTSIIMNSQKKIAWITGLGVIFLTLINFILIPQYGIEGAALGILLAQCFIMIITWSKTRSQFTFSMKNKITKIIIATTCMGIVLLAFHQLRINFLITILISSAIYCLMLYAIKEDSFKLLLRIIKGDI